jgi:hypothetical protein
MRLERLILALALTFPGAPAFANCEVGAYWIHTLAGWSIRSCA